MCVRGSQLAVENMKAQEHAEGALVRLSQDQSNRALIIKKLVQMLMRGSGGEGGVGGGAVNPASPPPPPAPREDERRDSRESRNSREGRASKEGRASRENMGSDAERNGQEQAAAALANLARESEENRNSIVNSNGIPPLLALIDSNSSKAKENAVGAITELCR